MNQLTKYQKEALKYNKHISLTANAGSGKTTVLSKRFVEILLKEDITLNNIIAITFTDKAASELYSKIAKELDDRILNETGINKSKIETLRRNLVSAKISTIHSFCIDILKDFAPEAGIDANFLPIDARTSDELLNQSIDEIINKNLKEDKSEIKNLIRIFGNKSQLISKIKLLFGKRKSTERLIKKIYSSSENTIANWLDETFKNKFKESFKNLIHELVREISKLNYIAGGYKSTEIYTEVERLITEINSKTNLINKLEFLKEIGTQILKQDGKVRQQKYLNGDIYKENEELIENINNRFSEIDKIEIGEDIDELNLELAKFGKTIINFYIDVDKRYKLKKDQKSFLDFEDLLLQTYRLLQQAEVINKLSQKYKYVMVDEYQDTNEIQYEIFMPILQYLSTGNLFVVGDDKQSIYMFREAEVKVFNETKKQIVNKEGEKGILQLPHSFRLAPNNALFANTLFNKIFENPNFSFNEVEYNNLICAYQKESKGKVEFLISDQEDEISEAELVAKKIIQIITDEKNNFSLKDITVLCKVRKNFIGLEKEFIKYKIPFSIVGGKGFFQQQLVLDIYNYMSFLINTKNDLALLSILRSPYFGISDIDLTEISFEEGENYFDKFKNYVQSKIKFQKHLSLLEKHINISYKTEISELIRIIHNDTGYWSFLANKETGKQDIANLEKLIQQSINITDEGFNTLYDFTKYLNDAINNLEDEGHAELDDTENSVRIMTIHQSKGLEFPIVILYKTNQRNFDETLKTKDIAVDKDFGILAKLPYRNNYFEDFHQAPIVGLYNYFQNKKSIAELKRLLYVALTRAEEYLIISLQHKNDKLIKNSFAEMVINSLGIDFDESVKVISGNLTFMKIENDVYETREEFITSEIKIINSIELKKSETEIEKNIPNKKYEFLLDKIKTSEKNEVISASKISLFLQCPRKYQLTYEFGYGELIKQFRENEDFEFNQKEEENIPANVLGKIIHSILEKQTAQEKLILEVQKNIEMEDELLILNNNDKEKLQNEILNLLRNFYQSKSNQKILEYQKFKNEIEIYKREKDYYLYGIIDKLIFDNNKIIIVDYKTDKVSQKNIEEKKETYFNQLLFYSYILINKYPEIENFELMLIFIRDDSFTTTKKVNKSEILNFGKVISDSVKKIRSKEFEEITPGCKNMEFYLIDECKK